MLMPSRSNRTDVRNPVLALPAAARLATLPEEARGALDGVLRDIARDASDRAEACWRKHKAPMAVYWKAVAVYARHIARATGRPRRATPPTCSPVSAVEGEAAILRKAIEQIEQLALGPDRGSAAWQAERAYEIAAEARREIEARRHTVGEEPGA